MMASSYKLHYFATVGLGETIRFLFAYGEIDFEDIRFTRAEFPEIKSQFPFGTAPVLEYKGRKVDQSIAIARYVAKQVKLIGDDDWENLEIDAIVDTINDFRSKFINQVNANKDTSDKVFLESLTFYLERLDAMIEKNKGFLVLKKLTWADFFLAGMSEALNDKFGKKIELFEKYPNIAAHKEMVLAIPQIAKWIATRPKSIM